jgi:hypothetical protein
LLTLFATLSHAGSVTQTHVRNTASSVFIWWDGLWYLRIAEHGYDPHFVQYSGGGPQTDAAFPPALATLMAGSHRFLGADYTIAGLVWCFLALVALGIGLVRLIQLDYGERVAVLTLTFLLLWPPAIFFGMLYQDGITLAGVVWAFVLVRRHRPALAGVALGLACLGKLVAVAALLALAIDHLRETDGRHRYRGLGLLAAGPVVAIVGWLLYSGARFHHLTAALDAERAWNHTLTTPWHSISATVDAIHHIPEAGYRAVLIGDFVAIGLLLVAVVYLALRRVRLSYVVYAATMLIVLTSDGQTASVSRYMLLAFPLFLAPALAVDWLYQRRSEAGVVVMWAAIAAAVPVQLWFISRFARYYWVG